MLKSSLNEAYKSEVYFWLKKSRVNWLKEGDKSTKYFHAVTSERRKKNRIEKLQTAAGTMCIEEAKIA